MSSVTNKQTLKHEQTLVVLNAPAGAFTSPSAPTCFDVAFKLKNHPFPGRLKPAPDVGSGAMIQQFSLTQLAEEVLTLLRLVYEEVGA